MQPVLVAYDCIITLGDEVELIWQGTWGITNWLFIVNRFSVVLSATVRSVSQNNFMVSVTGMRLIVVSARR